MKITKELAQFLGEKGALSKFINNAQEGTRLIPGHLVENIGDPFIWGLSTEGYGFWKNLSNEFEELKAKKKSRLFKLVGSILIIVILVATFIFLTLL